MMESCKLLWDAIKDGTEKEKLVSVLVKEYGINSKTALKDVNEFIEKLCDLGIVE